MRAAAKVCTIVIVMGAPTARESGLRHRRYQIHHVGFQLPRHGSVIPKSLFVQLLRGYCCTLHHTKSCRLRQASQREIMVMYSSLMHRTRSFSQQYFRVPTGSVTFDHLAHINLAVTPTWSSRVFGAAFKATPLSDH